MAGFLGEPRASIRPIVVVSNVSPDPDIGDYNVRSYRSLSSVRAGAVVVGHKAKVSFKSAIAPLYLHLTPAHPTPPPPTPTRLQSARGAALPAAHSHAVSRVVKVSEV